MKKFDYKTKGWIIIDVRLAGLFNISAKRVCFKNKKKKILERTYGKA